MYKIVEKNNGQIIEAVTLHSLYTKVRSARFKLEYGQKPNITATYDDKVFDFDQLMNTINWFDDKKLTRYQKETFDNFCSRKFVKKISGYLILTSTAPLEALCNNVTTILEDSKIPYVIDEDYTCSVTPVRAWGDSTVIIGFKNNETNVYLKTSIETNEKVSVKSEELTETNKKFMECYNEHKDSFWSTSDSRYSR